MITPSLLQPINTWESDSKVQVCVGVDIGGSGLRVRVSNTNNKAQFVDIPHIRAQSTEELVESLTNIQQTLAEIVPKFESCGAALAVAGPIKEGTVVLTNWPGDPSKRTLSLDHLPQRLFPKEKTAFLNDLEAGAYGIIAADEQKILDKHFVQLWKGHAPEGPIVSKTRTAILALGSGCGAALVVKTPLLQQPLVLPSELGHVQVPIVCEKDPGYQLERELIQHVSQYYYEGKQTPEFEDLSSGRGLQLCYQFFLKKNDNQTKTLEQIDAGAVASKAKEGDKTARDALFWNYKLFLRLAKIIGTSLQCDSIVMALDNQVKNSWFVDAVSNELREEFYNFIRPDWMKGIRVYSQIETLNFNILGNDYMAHQIAAHHQ